MADLTTVETQDVQAVLESHSFRRIQWLQLALGAGMLVIGLVLWRLYRIQSYEGYSLWEDRPWILVVLTLLHALIALAIVWRDRRFALTQWGDGIVDAQRVAALGWKSAPGRTPTEVALLLVEAYLTLRLVGYATLALFGLFVFWMSIVTSDLLKAPFYWINLASYLFWWVLWFRSFLTKGRAVKVFHYELARGTGSVQVEMPASV
jgi:hypothetical protein